jgi:hypothetical protein
MSKIIRSALIAVAFLTSASAAMAATPRFSPSVADQSDQYGGFSPSSTEGIRFFWQDEANRG